jgi:hypothetical protein
MKVIGILLIVIGVGVAVPATLTWWNDRSDAAAHEELLVELGAKREATLKQLHEINLRYRGYQKSVPQIPDSIRAAESAIISGRYKDYNKQISALETKETEQSRLLKRTRTKRAERAAEAKKSTLPFAAGAVLLLIAGAVVLRRA